MNLNFLDVCNNSYSPAFQTLISFLPPHEVLCLRQVCRAMRIVVNDGFTDSHAERMASRVLKLGDRKDFSLASTPVSCTRNRSFVEYAVRRNGLNYRYVGDELKRDIVIVKTSIASLKIAFQGDIESLCSAIPKDIYSRKDIQALLRADPFQIEKGVFMQQGLATAVEKGSPWNEDTDIALSSIRQDHHLFWFVNSSVRVNRDFLLEAVGQNGMVLAFVCGELKQDLEIVHAAVKADGESLRFACPKLRANKTIVLAAVQQDGFALMYAAPELRANREVVLAAIRQQPLAISFAAEELGEDLEILSVIRASPTILSVAASHWVVKEV